MTYLLSVMVLITHITITAHNTLHTTAGLMKNLMQVSALSNMLTLSTVTEYLKD
jgi:hypothetical protein